MKKLSVLVLVLLATTACPPDEGKKGELVTPAADGGSAATPPAGVSQTKIGALPMTAPVLIVEGATFSRADIERAISQHAASMGMPPDDLVPELRDTLELPAYEKLIDRSLFSAEAKKRGLWPTDQQVVAERDRILQSLPPAMTVEGFLQKLGTDDAGFQKEIAIDLALGKLFETLQKEQKPPDPALVKKFYDDNKDKFMAPEMASASHILVRLDRGASPADVEAAQKHAAAIRKEVAGKDKATFAKVALAKSEDPRVKDNKGDLGRFPRGVLVKELEEASFSLKDGQVSDIVRSDFGLHILRGQGISKAGLSTFEQVKAMIEQREGGKAFAASLDALAEGMRKTAKIQRVVEPAHLTPKGGGVAPPPPTAPPAPLPMALPPPAPTPPAAPAPAPVVVPPGGTTG
ncbi:MAG: peptidylprolyl isomerase [Deltaproteobacteria bacterium]|nr:peptidylprolyl isomerase [Deltaproteobacteria bacterium]